MRWIFTIIVSLVFAISFGACDDEPADGDADGDTDGDADTDTDVDGDTDGDTDTDADGDRDADGGGDADPDAPPLPPVVFPGDSWETRSPEDVGLDPDLLDDFREATGDRRGVIIRHGYLVYNWGDQTTKMDWLSAAKPVTATMLMFAVFEGKLSSVDDLVGGWDWEMSAKDSDMTFRHLANMVSGYALSEAPGEAWGYNDYAINLYSKTLFDRVFAEGSPDDVALHPSRFGALQLEDEQVYGSREGYGLMMSPRDFARIGWFWLNRGRWGDEQLLPTSYFDSYAQPGVPATTPRTSGGTDDYLSVDSFGGGTNQTPHGPGIYGFNWWFNPGQQTWPDVPEDAFQANGLWNEYALTVIPSLGIVAAWRGNRASTDEFAAPMNDELRHLVDAVLAP